MPSRGDGETDPLLPGVREVPRNGGTVDLYSELPIYATIHRYDKFICD
jgi:hypothetical protein